MPGAEAETSDARAADGGSGDLAFDRTNRGCSISSQTSGRLPLVPYRAMVLALSPQSMWNQKTLRFR